MKEIIPCSGKYHDATSVLARPEFRVLTEIERLQLKRDDY
jgi:hypothetical protein